MLPSKNKALNLFLKDITYSIGLAPDVLFVSPGNLSFSISSSLFI